MILAVALNRLWNLRHDRAALVLSYVVPIVFFSIFAAIFGRTAARSTTRRVSVAIADEAKNETSRRFIAALRGDRALSVATSPEALDGRGAPASGSPARGPFTAATAEAAVRSGSVPIALILPKYFGAGPPSPDHPRVSVLSDPSDPLAPQVLSGVVQKAATVALPETIVRASAEVIDRWGGGLTPQQRIRLEESLSRIREERVPASTAAVSDSAPGLVRIDRRDVLGEQKKKSMVAFYAAGIGVMFLLFSAAGAGGAIIEEAESGTFDRILSTRVTMSRLLAGKLVYLAGLAATQLLVMFLWGSIAFGLPMSGHWAGFIVMTVATALAASTFGLLLASVSRSRTQLVAISNLTVLVMSAIGGSIVPRFIMPAVLQKVGLLTLNAWAIDGFQKVFWRNEPVSSLWPQVTVLCAIALLFFFLARRIARRWEAV